MKTTINLTNEDLENLETIKRNNNWITNMTQAIRYAIAVCRDFEEENEDDK